MDLLVESHQTSAWDYAQYLKETETNFSRVDLSSTSMFIVDYPTRQYPLVGRNAEQVMGHHREAFLEGGLEFMLHHYYDFELMNTRMFPDEVRFFNEHPTADLSNIRFSRSYRFRRHSGELSTIMQRITILRKSQQLQPLAAFGVVWDITSFTDKSKLVHQIEEYDPLSARWKPLLHKEYYPDTPNNRLLSKREIEILKWAVEGYASKHIADKMHISFNTVNTHRRNMLRKTNCKNALDLLRYAIENKLI